MAGYLGNIPSAVPLTSADIADGIITSAKIADGTIVNAVMHISNLDEDGTPIESLYKLKGGEICEEKSNYVEDILVSGSHLVYVPSTKIFDHVENLLEAEKTDILCEKFTCLITSNHTIPIGKWIFHDWEDNNGSKSKS